MHAMTPVTTSSNCDMAVDLCQLIPPTTSTTNHDAPPHLLAANAPRKCDKHHNHHHDNHHHHRHASKRRQGRLKQTAGVQGTPPFLFFIDFIIKLTLACHHPPSLETRAEGFLLSPTTTSACQHPLRRSKRERRGFFCHQPPPLPTTNPSVARNTSGGVFFVC